MSSLLLYPPVSLFLGIYGLAPQDHFVHQCTQSPCLYPTRIWLLKVHCLIFGWIKIHMPPPNFLADLCRAISSLLSGTQPISVSSANSLIRPTLSSMSFIHFTNTNCPNPDPRGTPLVNARIHKLISASYHPEHFGTSLPSCLGPHVSEHSTPAYCAGTFQKSFQRPFRQHLLSWLHQSPWLSPKNTLHLCDMIFSTQAMLILLN